MACIFNRIEDESLLENVDLDGLECIGVVKSDKEIARFDAVAKDFMLMDDNNECVKGTYNALKKIGII